MKSYVLLSVEVDGPVDWALDNAGDIVRSIYVNNPDVHNVIVLDTLPAPEEEL